MLDEVAEEGWLRLVVLPVSLALDSQRWWLCVSRL